MHLGLTGVGVWSQLECARGRRLCEEEGCSKGARGSTGFCKAHGGGRRCQHEGCTTAATTGGTLQAARRIARRMAEAARRRAVPNRTKVEQAIARRMARGKRCQEEGCTKSDQGGAGSSVERTEEANDARRRAARRALAALR